jgi:hypothetical protein
MTAELRSAAIVALLVIVGSTGLHAQRYAIDRGVWQPGGSIDFSHSNPSSGGAATSILFAPSVGYFFWPRVSLGIAVPLGYYHSSNSHSYQYGFAPRITYYLRGGEHSFYPFLSGAVGRSWYSGYTNGSGLISRDAAWSSQASVGGVQLVSRNVGIRGEIYYDHLRWTSESVPNSSTSHYSNSSVGLQFGIDFFVF